MARDDYNDDGWDDPGAGPERDSTLQGVLEEMGEEVQQPVLAAPPGASAPMTARHGKPVGFDAVAGMRELKAILFATLIAPLKDPVLASVYGLDAGTKVMLWGPPGCGKTFFARAAAEEAGATFVPINLTDILNSHFGNSEGNIAQAFADARDASPAVLFFDEADSLMPNRNGPGMWEIERRLTTSFLQQLQGAKTSAERVAIIGATNQPWLIDPAILRAGRFDRLVYVGLPDEAARKEMWDTRVMTLPLGPDIDTCTLADLSRGLTGAEIEEAIQRVRHQAFIEADQRGGTVEVRMLDLLLALRATRPRSGQWLHQVPPAFAHNQRALVEDARAVAWYGGREWRAAMADAIGRCTQDEVDAWDWEWQRQVKRVGRC